VAVDLGEIEIDKPGSGGVNRGRGDAPMAWGKGTEGETDRFQVKPLTPGSEPDPRRSTLLGVSASEPDVKPELEGSSRVDAAASPGSVAWRRRLAPRHREAVKAFFTQEKPK
jgi:hypothetical protein